MYTCMCAYGYVRFVIGFFCLLCTLGTPWANYIHYSVAFPEKVWMCRNAAV